LNIDGMVFPLPVAGKISAGWIAVEGNLTFRRQTAIEVGDDPSRVRPPNVRCGFNVGDDDVGAGLAG
jgi:hypothetical protein